MVVSVDPAMSGMRDEAMKSAEKDVGRSVGQFSVTFADTSSSRAHSRQESARRGKSCVHNSNHTILWYDRE